MRQVLVEGVQSAWQFGGGPLFVAFAAMSGLLAVVLRLAKGVALVRKEWHEGSKAKAEVRLVAAETRKAVADAEEVELRVRREGEGAGGVPSG